MYSVFIKIFLIYNCRTLMTKLPSYKNPAIIGVFVFMPRYVFVLVNLPVEPLRLSVDVNSTLN